MLTRIDADLGGGVLQQRPLGVVRAPQPDPVAGLQAERRAGPWPAGDPLGELGVRPADALVAGDERLAVAVGGDRAGQVGADRLVEQRDVGASGITGECHRGPPSIATHPCSRGDRTDSVVRRAARRGSGSRADTTAPVVAITALRRKTAVNDPSQSASSPPTWGAAIWETPKASVAALNAGAVGHGVGGVDDVRGDHRGQPGERQADADRPEGHQRLPPGRTATVDTPKADERADHHGPPAEPVRQRPEEDPPEHGGQPGEREHRRRLIGTEPAVVLEAGDEEREHEQVHEAVRRVGHRQRDPAGDLTEGAEPGDVAPPARPVGRPGHGPGGDDGDDRRLGLAVAEEGERGDEDDGPDEALDAVDVPPRLVTLAVAQGVGQLAGEHDADADAHPDQPGRQPSTVRWQRRGGDPWRRDPDRRPAEAHQRRAPRRGRDRSRRRTPDSSPVVDRHSPMRISQTSVIRFDTVATITVPRR